MKYEQPRLVEFKAEQGAGWCIDGSLATSGAVYMYCITGTAQSGSAAYCNSGAANFVVPEQCDAGLAVGSPPACSAGSVAETRP